MQLIRRYSGPVQVAVGAATGLGVAKLVPVYLGLVALPLGLPVLLARRRVELLLSYLILLLLIPPTVSNLQVAAILAFELTAVAWVATRTKDFRATLLLVGLVVALGYASTLGAHTSGQAFAAKTAFVVTTVQFGFVWAGLAGTFSANAKRRIAALASSFGVALSAWAIGEWLLGRGLVLSFIHGARRSMGPFGPNGFGSILAQLAVISLASALLGRGIARLWHGFAFGLAGAGVLATASRGALLGLVAGACVMLMVLARHRHRRIAPILLLMIVLSAPVLAQQVRDSRLAIDYGTIDQRAEASDEQTLQARLEAARYAVKIAADHPLTGAGLNSFASLSANNPKSPLFINTHNEALRLAAEAGIPALLFIIALVAAAVRNVVRNGFECRMLAVPVFACYIVITCFLNTINHPALSAPVLLLLFITAGARTVSTPPDAVPVE